MALRLAPQLGQLIHTAKFRFLLSTIEHESIFNTPIQEARSSNSSSEIQWLSFDDKIAGVEGQCSGS